MQPDFHLASAADDADIRRLLRHSPVPGSITLTYEREPDYFLGCGTMGHFYQVPIGRHPDDGTLLGISCRATRPLYVNGQVEEVGYLGQLRIDSRFQGRWLLSRAFRYLRDLHTDGRVSSYITTIIADNPVAEGVLVSRARPHFPVYRELDQVHTLALVLSCSPLLRVLSGSRADPDVRISRGSADDLEEIAAFYQAHGGTKQFFPAYTANDFCDSPLTRDFRVEDFLLARRGSQLVGVLGLWDQSGYKQTVVQTYSPALRRLQPVSRLVAGLAGMSPLPAPGAHLSYIYASFICVHNNDPAIFRPLLWHAYQEAARRGYTFLMLGLTAHDPLLAVARRYLHIPYISRLYTVCWHDDPPPTLHERLDGRVVYVELAAL